MNHLLKSTSADRNKKPNIGNPSEIPLNSPRGIVNESGLGFRINSHRTLRPKTSGVNINRFFKSY